MFNDFQSHDHTVVDLRRIVKLVVELTELPKRSPLQFLGYFAVLESLLTHMPKPTDPYETITRQIKQKVKLLDRRWKPSLDYGFFNGAPPDKIWAKMYSYRSALAHGSEPDFNNDLKLLGNANHALKLLKGTVKRTIRQVLKEPELIRDIRDI